MTKEVKVNEATRMLLRKNYEAACNAYANAFCEKHGYYKLNDVSARSDTYWVADDAGGILAMGDEFVDMATIVEDIDKDASKGEWERWQAYTDEAAYVFGRDSGLPNYRSWLRGCPRVDGDTLTHLREMKEQLNREMIDAKLHS